MKCVAGICIVPEGLNNIKMCNNSEQYSVFELQIWLSKDGYMFGFWMANKNYLYKIFGLLPHCSWVFFCSFGNVLQHRLLLPSGTLVKNEYSRASTSIMCVYSGQGCSCLIFNTDVVIRPAIASFVVKYVVSVVHNLSFGHVLFMYLVHGFPFIVFLNNRWTL